MASGNRPARVGEAIREILAQAVTRGLKTPGVGFCTITGVEVTKDLRQAKVFVSVYGDDAARSEVVDDLGKRSWLSSEKARTTLGWTTRPVGDSIEDCARSLLR